MLPTFLLYLLVLLAIGWLAFRQRSEDANDFMLSRREHGSWVSALSASASSESGWVMLGLTGMGYTMGVSCFWILPTALAGYLFNWFVMGPRLHRLATTAHCSSVPDVFDARFPHANPRLLIAIRSITVLVIIVFMGFYVAAQFTATGKALQAMFGWDYRVGVLLGTVIVIFYTALGGMRAISWTDVLQAILMVMALVALPILVITTAISDTDFVAALSAADPKLLDWRGGTTGLAALSLTVGWLALGLGYPGQPHVLRRFLAARDQQVFRRAPWIALLWSQAVFSGAISLGLAARVAYPDIMDPEQALPVAAVNLLPPALAGLVLAAVFSAICSTADSQLLETAGAVAHDTVYGLRRYNKRKKGSVWKETLISRVTVVIVGLLASLFALIESRAIFTMVLYSWAALAASIGVTLTMVLLWWRTTAMAVLLGLLMGPATVIIWRSALGWNAYVSEIVPGVLVSLLVMVIVSLLQAPRPHSLDIETPNGST